MLRRTIVCLGVLLSAALYLSVAPPAKSAEKPVAEKPAAEKPAAETPAQRDARMQWWREARFGMFIHWGLYAIPAGHWEGKPVGGIGEWIMDRANIPVDEYEKLAKQFNPTGFDPQQWAKLARQAGIKYLVITSKHHDGFCLFGTETTDYDVVDATPYKKDLLRPLAEACRQQGIKFCTYYSIMDWHHPAQERGSDNRYNPTKMKEGRKDEYVKFMKQQLKDLLDGCDPEVLWFDGEWPNWWTEEDGQDLYAYLRRLKPSLIVNNRVGKGRKGMEGLSKGDREYSGDFGTPEQQIPATGLPGVDWESCMTMNDTWGFKQDDHNWKSAETLIRNLIDIASKGGNYLLNVGPTAKGEIPAASVERLEAMGAWMKINGESIYGTQASPFKRLPWGRCTAKPHAEGTTLYLHVFDWPDDGKLVVPGLKNEPTAAYLLAKPGEALKVDASDAGLVVSVPAAPDKIASVVVLKVKGTPVIEPALLSQRPDGTIDLPAAEAALRGHTIKLEGSGKANVGFWTNPAEGIDWTFQVNKPGRFAVVADLAAARSGSFVVAVPADKLTAKAPVTGDYKKYETVSLGTLTITAPGKCVLSIQPVADGWQPMNVRRVTLRPVE